MSRGGIGSASIMLVFVVLCLVIFSVISLVPALNSQTLIQAEVQLVTDFFAADALAEQIVAELITLDETPASILGIDIESYWSWDLFIEMASFAIPISDTQVLYVEIGIDFGSYEIFGWRMYNMEDWIADESLNVWTGELDEDFFSGW